MFISVFIYLSIYKFFNGIIDGTKIKIYEFMKAVPLLYGKNS
jgi:hypothetical protein